MKVSSIPDRNLFRCTLLLQTVYGKIGGVKLFIQKIDVIMVIVVLSFYISRQSKRMHVWDVHSLLLTNLSNPRNRPIYSFHILH